MVGNMLILLPLGLLPIVFIVFWAVFHSAEDGLQKSVGSKIRAGITEYPTDVSMMLSGTNKNEIKFSEDGRSVVLTIESPSYISLDSTANVRKHFNEMFMHEGCGRGYPDMEDKYTIDDIVEDKEAGTHQIVISLPDEVVLTDDYIEHEIKNVGCVFERNSGNSHRHLLYSQINRRIERKGGKLLVFIDRLQVVPGILNHKQVFMSEKQITRNIENRLWNRVKVNCISIGEREYCGEILGV